MRFSHDGLVVWYATTDAPAPEDVELPGTGLSLTVGVQPASPVNTVEVRFRVDGGPARSVRASLVRTDYASRTQYFRVTLPDFWEGEQVEYVPFVSCAGRTAPAPADAASFPSAFRIRPRRPSPPSQPAPPARFDPAPVYHIQPTFLAAVRVRLQRLPEVVGPTPEGLLVSWYPASGEVMGPRLRARVRDEGTHALTVRTDGVGLIHVDTALETDDGALLNTSYSGSVDLGIDGYQRMLEGKWPRMLRVSVAPRFLSGHAQYQWLNRLQCVGVGELRPAELMYAYDLYGLE
jgi:Protein of unknown function (DUF3237)